MANKLFGTDGIRGIANIYPMTAEVAFRLGQVLARLQCQTTKQAVIGKDTRLSGDMLEAALTAGFTSSGVNVIRLGIVPTPLLTSAMANLKADVAVMITASHNPYQDNGLKVINALGDKLSDEESAKIEDLLLSETVFEASAQDIGTVTTDLSPVENYIRQALTLAPKADSLRGLRVVLDCANGAFSEIMPRIFKSLGAGVITLSNTPNGLNINQDCGSQHTENLQRTVAESHAHLGIAADGDGDRIIICDEKGQRIDGDQIIAFLATYLQRENKLKGGAAVATIWSNLGLEKYLRGIGIGFYRTPVGERYVIEKMRETGSNVGGEESGHMVLSDYAKTGDALLTGLVIALGLMKSGKKMSEIFPLFVKCPCALTQVRFDDKTQADETFRHPQVVQAVSQASDRLKNPGSVIVRQSGTEAVIKIRVEAEDADLVQDISTSLTNIIKQTKQGQNNA